MKPFPKTTFFLLTLALILCYFFVDRDVAYLCENLPHLARKITKYPSRLMSPPLNLVTFCLISLYFFCTNRKKWWNHPVTLIAATQALGTGLTRLCKISLGRSRPDMLFSQGFYGFEFFSFNHHFHAFPSGHTVIIFGLAYPLSLYFPKYRYPLLITASLFALTRAVLTYHFLTDIIGGALFAIAACHLSITILAKLPRRFCK